MEEPYIFRSKVLAQLALGLLPFTTPNYMCKIRPYLDRTISKLILEKLG
jgi:hypothetical protein